MQDTHLFQVLKQWKERKKERERENKTCENEGKDNSAAN